MPGPQLQTTAIVLAKRPSGSDSFEQLTAFSGEQGMLHCLRRITQSKPAAPLLDLFDETELWLESTSQGRTWFIKEHRLILRQPGLGRSYETLRTAAALSQLISRNPVSDESRPAVAELLRSSLAALAGGGRPDITWLKALYCFLRDEGYPVKQQWWPELPAAERELAVQLLNQPLAAQSAPPEAVAPITRRLEEWLHRETELRV
jgi:recombinational DNA repair protein (RecF pathway)